MKLFNGLSFALLTILMICPNSFADTVILKNGGSIKGVILVEKKSELVVDIGITVLVIPKEKILKYEYEDKAQATQPGKPTGKVEQAEPQDGKIYYTKKLKKKTIEKCVDEFAQAVVKVSSPGGMGSGFFINEQGYLITNYHVIERETKIEVTVFQDSKNGFEKKNFKKVKIEAINPFVDLALLKVQELGDTKIKHVYLGNLNNLKVGEGVFAIGNPLGLERTVSQGIVSTKNRASKGLIYIQTTADINPGNSGGPLFDLAGQVVGVINAGYIFYGGLGFAIPIDYVKHFLENRDAFAYDKDNPNTGFKYIQPGKRINKNTPNRSKESKND